MEKVVTVNMSRLTYQDPSKDIVSVKVPEPRGGIQVFQPHNGRENLA